jgi:hypothetical protein
MPKVQLHVKVEKDTLDKFRELVRVKYEGYAGGPAIHGGRAGSSLGSQHKQSTLFPANGMRTNPAPKSARLKHQIYAYLKEAKGIDRPYTISIKFLHEAIAALRDLIQGAMLDGKTSWASSDRSSCYMVARS